MEYIEGGAVHISNSSLRNGVFVVLSLYASQPVLVAAGIAKVAGTISTVVSKFLKWVGSVFGGTVGGFVGWAVGSFCGYELGKAVFLAIKNNTGITISLGGFSAEGY